MRVGTDYWIPCVCVCVGGMDRFVGWWNGPFCWLVEWTVLEGVSCDRRVLLLLLLVVARLPGLMDIVRAHGWNGVARGFPDLNPTQEDMQNKTAMVRMRLGGIPQGVRGAYTPQAYTSQAQISS